MHKVSKKMRQLVCILSLIFVSITTADSISKSNQIGINNYDIKDNKNSAISIKQKIADAHTDNKKDRYGNKNDNDSIDNYENLGIIDENIVLESLNSNSKLNVLNMISCKSTVVKDPAKISSDKTLPSTLPSFSSLNSSVNSSCVLSRLDENNERCVYV